MLHAPPITKRDTTNAPLCRSSLTGKQTNHGPMDISIVIPVHNEAENIAPLVSEITAALDSEVRYEIIYVDDGSSDGSVGEIRRLAAEHPTLRLLRHLRCCGQSAALSTGVRAARGTWIATLDGDGQNDPADLRQLWRIACTAPAEPPMLIAGHRERRHDNWSRRAASRIANRVRSRILGDATPDTGCGLKLFPRALFLDLPPFDHMHRFLPALVLRAGGTVRSVPVNHRPRRSGASKYGILDRLGVGIVDLFGVAWLQRRAIRPLVSELLPGADASPTTAATARPVSNLG
jgi:dolichol-phosphate mannosyltransferase